MRRLISLDDGKTWNAVGGNVRLVVEAADVDDDGPRDLHINLTDEGLVLDLVQHGDVVGTGATLYSDKCASLA